MTVEMDVIDLKFWQGPVDGWHYAFLNGKIPSKIQFICDCTQLQDKRYAIYRLNLRTKRYEYVGSSRYLQRRIPVVESLLAVPFYLDKKHRMLLQFWFPVSSLREGELQKGE